MIYSENPATKLRGIQQQASATASCSAGLRPSSMCSSPLTRTSNTSKPRPVSGRRRRPRCPRQPNRNPGTSRPSPSERPSIAPGGPGHRNHSVASAIAFTRCACSPHQPIASNRRPPNPPIGRFGPCPKAPSTSGVQTNLGLLSEVMRHPSLVSCRARGRRRPTFFVSVARPRPPLLSDGRGVR